jgi:heme exporter protein D
MSEFFAMGGYAAYVWSAYAATFAGLGAAIVVTCRAYRAAQKRLAELEANK